MVSTKTASEARGYNAETEVPAAEEDHANRISRIKDAQSPTVDDLTISGDAARDEKEGSQNADLQGDSHKPVRGTAK